MQSKEKNNVILVRLFSDEDIYQCLKEVCRRHDVETAVVLSAIGQMKHFTLGYFKEKGNYTPQDLEQPHELLSIDGIISREQDDYSFHLHAVLGNEEKQAVGGHLLKGMAHLTNEIVLLKTSIKVSRRVDKNSGLSGLFLED